ncbi:YHYH protein [Pseudoalteromonas agarivorans]|uniref:YHYH protein n=1 Tax=Pseudoalteromonas agarivorans TaxID=176102 RepID=UPI00311E53F1
MALFKLNYLLACDINSRKAATVVFLLSCALLLSACEKHTKNESIAAPSFTKNANSSSINTDAFNVKAMVKLPQTVDCTLENGLESQCAQIVLKYQPDNIEVGPFCPETLNDVGGIWDWDGTDAGLYRLDEAFLTMLNEQGFTFYDEDGNVHIVDNATIRPSVDHACINVSVDKSVEITALLPLHPVMAKNSKELGVVSKVGIALAGVPIFSDAPSVQHTGHLPALDTCAGHIDPGGWYHYHGTASDIDSVYKHEHVNANCNNLPQAPSALFGYGFDGFPIYGSLEVDDSIPTDLDSCNGHTGPTGEKGIITYHYHASNTFPNLPKCLKGVVAENNFTTTAQAGIGAKPPQGTKITRHEPPGGGGGKMPRPDFSQAAKKLGISEQLLLKTMQDAGGPNADLSVVAKKLNVTQDELKSALPKKPTR